MDPHILCPNCHRSTKPGHRCPAGGPAWMSVTWWSSRVGGVIRAPPARLFLSVLALGLVVALAAALASR